MLNYPHLSSKQLEYWARRAAREWSLRPGPMMTFAKAAANRDTLGQLWRIGPADRHPLDGRRPGALAVVASAGVGSRGGR